MLTLKQAAQWCDGSVAPEYANIEITGISTDTRAIQPGELFIALQGDTFDGHIFVRQALEKGAGAVMTHKQMGPGEIVDISEKQSAYVIRFDALPTERRISFRVKLTREES